MSCSNLGAGSYAVSARAADGSVARGAAGK
jgi:hypothetical protein